MGRRILISALLVVAFLFLEAILVFPLASEICFRTAGKLENGFQWRRAEELYRQASFLSPFDTKYLTEYADFLLRQSAYRKDKVALYKEAEELYVRALAFNPHCAEYALMLGRLEIGMFLDDKGTFKAMLTSGLKNLDRAVQNDPNGANTSFLAGKIRRQNAVRLGRNPVAKKDVLY